MALKRKLRRAADQADRGELRDGETVFNKLLKRVKRGRRIARSAKR